MMRLSRCIMTVSQKENLLRNEVPDRVGRRPYVGREVRHVWRSRRTREPLDST